MKEDCSFHKKGGLAIIETHPVQYRAPLYRLIQKKFHIPIIAIYGSDFSVNGYYDEEFDSTFAWDTDLLTGYNYVFLSRVKNGGARCLKEVSGRGIRNILMGIKPKVVMITGYSPFFHQVAFFETYRLGYPIIFRAETTTFYQRNGFLINYFRTYILKWMYSKCSILLYTGKRSYQHFKRIGCPEEKMIFSPYSVDNSSFQSDERYRFQLRYSKRKELGISEKDIVILFSGKLSQKKNPLLILYAVKNMPRYLREQFFIVFLGDGQLKEGIRRFARVTPQVRIHITGFKNQTELSPYYHMADLLVLPSLYPERWGLVVNEALMHGLPCIVSDNVGCAPDLVENGVTGYIFDSNSIDSLMCAILKGRFLINRLDIKERCRDKVSDYSIVNSARGIAQAFNIVVSKVK